MKTSFIKRKLPTVILFATALATLVYMNSFAGFINAHGLSGLLLRTGDLLLVTQGIMVLIALWGSILYFVTASWSKES